MSLSLPALRHPLCLQLPHCAPTYSAVLSLATLGTPAALAVINRPALYAFFTRMKQPCGGFAMHDDGETDVRATYTVVAVSVLTNILTPELREGAAEYLLRCGPTFSPSSRLEYTYSCPCRTYP